MADYTVTAANVIPGANAEKFLVVAGEALTAGQPVYQDSTTKSYFKADANVLAKSVAVAIALNGASAGQPVGIARSDLDFTPGFTIAAGEVVIVSDTPGGLKPVADAVAGDYVTVCMVGTGSNKAKLSFVSAGAPVPEA